MPMKDPSPSISMLFHGWPEVSKTIQQDELLDCDLMNFLEGRTSWGFGGNSLENAGNS